jgi:uncharacterized membrane protein YkoI
VVFSEAVNLLKPEDFKLKLIVNGETENIEAESIELDESNTKLIFKLKFDKSIDNGKIRISTKNGSLAIQSKADSSQYYTEFPQTGKLQSKFIDF